MSETKFYRDSDGRYIGAFVGAPPPAGAIEVATPPQDARQLWSAGAWQPVPPPGYRDRRARDYALELGDDPGDIIKTLGDVLDDVIREIRARGATVTPDFAALASKIDAIKARHPRT